MQKTIGVALVTVLLLLLVAGCADKSQVAAAPGSAQAAGREFLLASVDGADSARDWVNLDGDEVRATGTIGGGSSVVQIDGGRIELGLIVEETVGTAKLYHGLPIYLSSATKATLDGQSVDIKALENPGDVDAPALSQTDATVVCRIVGDRLDVLSLAATTRGTNLPPDYPDDVPNAIEANAAPEATGDRWLSVSNGQTVDIQAYPLGTTSSNGDLGKAGTWGTYAIRDRMDTATIFHLLVLDNDVAPRSSATPPEAIETRFRYEDGRFLALN